MDHAFAMKLFGALFAIMNPLTVLPIFLALTEGMTVAEQRATAVKVTLYTAIMCAVVALAGLRILDLFGITPNDFRVAGGLVVAVIGFGMLNGAGNPAHEGGAGEKQHQASVEEVAFYPLAFPMVVGPGTITTLIVFRQQATGPAGLGLYAGIVAAMVLLVGICLFFSPAFGRHLSMTLRAIMSRLMGVILLAIGVDMIIAGLRVLLPGLAGLPG